MMGKDCSPNPVAIQGRIRTPFNYTWRRDSQALNDAESAEAKIVSKHGEEPLKESRGPADFRKEEDDDLSNYQKAVEDGPEDAGRLVRNG